MKAIEKEGKKKSKIFSSRKESKDRNDSNPTSFKPRVTHTQQLLPVDESNPYLDKNLRNRNRVINEIINTERDYLDDLHVIVEVFIPACREQFGFSVQQINQIFSYIEPLIAVNTKLLSDMERNVRDQLLSVADVSSVTSISRSLLKLSNHLQVYSLYCSSRENSLQTIEGMKKADSSFAKFLENFPMLPECHGLGINDFLIKPLQRICKYPLFLRELLKYTSEEDSGYPILKQAFTIIEEIVEKINKEKAKKENSDKILEIAQLIDDENNLQLLQPTRVYIKEGDLSVCGSIADLKEEKTKEMYCYLFNDLMILTKKKKHSCHVAHKLPLDRAILSDLSQRLEGSFPNSFEIIVSGMDGRKFLFSAPSLELKMEWFNLLEKYLNESVENEIVRHSRERRSTVNTNSHEPLINFNSPSINRIRYRSATFNLTHDLKNTRAAATQPASEKGYHIVTDLMDLTFPVKSQQQQQLRNSCPPGDLLTGSDETPALKPSAPDSYLIDPLIPQPFHSPSPKTHVRRRSTSTPPTISSQEIPTMTDEDRYKYDRLFITADKDGDGFINEQEGEKFFSVSRLTPALLKHVWQLADRDKDRRLSSLEFRLAMHLIYCSLKGHNLPASVSKPVLWSAGLNDLRPLPSIPQKRHPIK